MIVGFTITDFKGHEDSARDFIRKVCVLEDASVADNIVRSGEGVNVYAKGLTAEELSALPFSTSPIYTREDAFVVASMMDFPVEFPMENGATARLLPTQYMYVGKDDIGYCSDLIRQGMLTTFPEVTESGKKWLLDRVRSGDTLSHPYNDEGIWIDSAVWQEESLSVNVSFNQEHCNVVGSGQYSDNDTVTIECIPNRPDGKNLYAFVKWLDTLTGEAVKDNPLTFNIHENRSFTAITEFIGAILTVNIEGIPDDEPVTFVKGAPGAYEKGSRVVIECTFSTSYQVSHCGVGWNPSVSGVTRSFPGGYCALVVNMQEDVSVTIHLGPSDKPFLCVANYDKAYPGYLTGSGFYDNEYATIESHNIPMGQCGMASYEGKSLNFGYSGVKKYVKVIYSSFISLYNLNSGYLFTARALTDGIDTVHLSAGNRVSTILSRPEELKEGIAILYDDYPMELHLDVSPLPGYYVWQITWQSRVGSGVRTNVDKTPGDFVIGPFKKTDLNQFDVDCRKI